MTKHRKTCAEYAREYMIDNGMSCILTHDCGPMDEIASLCKHTNLIGHGMHPLTRHERLMNYLSKSKLFFVDVVSMPTGRRGNQTMRRAWLIDSIDEFARQHNPHLPMPNIERNQS